MKELAISQTQDISGQLSRQYDKLGLKNDPIKLLSGEFCEVAEAYQEHFFLQSKETRDHLQEELGDLIFCVMAIANQHGIDMNEAMNDTFTKNWGRVNDEWVEMVRQSTGLEGIALYKEAKRLFSER